MALRDIAGRLLSRLRGTAARNRYASIVQQKIQVARSQEELRGFLKELPLNKRAQRQAAQRGLESGTLPQGREELGIEIPLNEQQIEAQLGWQSVSSSNVEAIRWVGGNWGAQVKFLAKKNSPSSEYEYFATFQEFLDLKNASSKGKHIWQWRREGKPYHRISGGRGKETIMYPWGQVSAGPRKFGTREQHPLEIPTRPADWWRREGKTERDYRKLYYGK